MSPKKKLVVMFSAFAMIVFAGVIAVAMALAASTITVKNQMKIKYVVDDVACEISFYYDVVSTSATSISWQSISTAKFDLNGLTPDSTGVSGETDGNEAISEIPDEIEISRIQCVVLKFDFKNITGRDFNAILNIYSSSGTIANSNLNFFCSEAQDGLPALNDVESSYSAGQAISVGANASKSYYLKIAVKEPKQGVDFGFNIQWDLGHY